jgi:hypothetical protein
LTNWIGFFVQAELAAFQKLSKVTKKEKLDEDLKESI